MSKSHKFVALIAFLLLGATVIASASTPQHYGFGKPASPALQAAWNDDVRGIDGKGLPPGHGTVKEGQKVYAQKCAYCHGDFGEGNARYPELAGGRGTLTADRPLKTIGSYWPYAPTVFDYIRRAMPFNAPGSMTNNETYAVTAFLLNLNDILPADGSLDAKSLAAVKMPNRHGFIDEHLKPDVHAVACMHNCKKSVKITSNLARTLGITPDETGDTPSQTIATGGSDDGSAGGAGAAKPAPGVSGPDMSSTPGTSTTPAASGNPGSTATTPAASASATPGMSTASSKPAASSEVTFSQVGPIIAKRCEVCHAAHPKQAGFTEAAGGLKLETPAEIKAASKRIKARAVDSHSMPLGNLTNMTTAERTLVGKWVTQGAPL